MVEIRTSVLSAAGTSLELVVLLVQAVIWCGRLLLSSWMDGWLGGWMDGWMDGWLDGWMNGWLNGWMDGLVGGWMDGWMLCRLGGVVNTE